MDKRTLSIPEVAGLLGISQSLAYKLAREGVLPGVRRLGEKRLVILRDAFEKFLQEEENIPQGRVISIGGF
ncbi:MAG: helix-turn-helix transcriptional regulator [Bacillota bacterium]